jgi:hypothetical protein
MEEQKKACLEDLETWRVEKYTREQTEKLIKLDKEVEKQKKNVEESKENFSDAESKWRI